MYFVTSMWRGALHINPMRLFGEEDEAQRYALGLDGYPSYVRIYKLSPDKPPVPVKIK